MPACRDAMIDKAWIMAAAFYGSGCVIAAVIMAVRVGVRVNRAEAGCGLAGGVAAGLAALALLGAMKLPAASAFPVVQGSSLLASVLLCAAVFREELTARKLGALAVGLGAMVRSSGSSRRSTVSQWFSG